MCDNCKRLLAFSDAMGKTEAEKKKSKLVMNSFGAPRCKNKKCKSVEPYRDINLMHIIEVVNYDKGRTFANPLIK